MKNLIAAIVAGATLAGCIAVPVYGPPRGYGYSAPPAYYPYRPYSRY